MNTFLLKGLKYLAIIYLAIIPIVFLVIAYLNIIKDGNIYHSILFVFHPVIIFLIIKLIIRQNYFKSYLFMSVVLSIEVYAQKIIIDLFFKPEVTEIGYYEKITILYTVIFIMGYALLKMITKEKKSPKTKNTSVRQEYSFTFETSQGKVFLDNPFRGVYIQGGAGSGKGGSLFNPIISQSSKMNFAGILYDFKSPELTKHLYHEYKKNSSNIELFFVNFKTPTESHRINPINPNNIIKSAYATEFSKAIINNLLPETVKQNEFFGRSALSILSGTIWFMKKKHPEKCTLPHIISLFLHTDITVLLNHIEEEPEAYGMVASLKQAIDRGAEKQVAGILSTLQNALAQLNTSDIFWILSGDDLDLDLNNPINPKFLCVGNDSSLPEVYTPVIALIISVASRIMNQPNKHQSIIILDEAPTLYIPKFEQIPATARSNKVVTVYGAQDFSQMVDCYEENKSQVILSNLGNQFYGRTTNDKSTNMIKNVFSREDKVYVAKSENDGTSGKYLHLNSSKGKGMSESIQERDRVKISDITTMNPGEFYGLIAEGEPRELLKVQLKFHELKGGEYCFKEKATIIEMEENYKRIVFEAKNLFNQEESNTNDFEFNIS